MSSSSIALSYAGVARLTPDQRKRLAVIDSDRVKRLPEALMSGFSWRTSPQGHEYWQIIHGQLSAIADVLVPAKCPTCGTAETEPVATVEQRALLQIRDRDSVLVDGVARDLANSFIWDSTAEGQAYWTLVHSKLARIASVDDNKRVCGECGRITTGAVEEEEEENEDGEE